MKTDVNLALQLKEVLQKESGVVLDIEEAKTGLENLAKFFELLWEFDQNDKRKEREMEI